MKKKPAVGGHEYYPSSDAEAASPGEEAVSKVKGVENPADLLTKHLGCEDIEKIATLH